MTALAERAVELARRLDDPVAECAALDALTGAQRRAGDTFAAAATARRRVELLESVPVTPGTADELIDALLIATATSIGVGDLPAARRWGRQLRDLPAAGRGRARRHVTAPRWPTPSPATPPT